MSSLPIHYVLEGLAMLHELFISLHVQTDMNIYDVYMYSEVLEIVCSVCIFIK